MKRVTLKQVAARAGVHYTTVSRALGNDASIPPATRARLRRLAEKMGYRPDAMLSSLIAYRRGLQRPCYNATLAWITNHPTRTGWREQGRITPPYQGAVSAIYHEAARERAAELGYGLDEFWLREPGVTPERLSNILSARNIQGVLIAPLPRARSHIRLDWPRFSALAIGFSLAHPPLHVAGSNHYHSMTHILRELKARGYRKIGLALFFDVDERVDNHYRAAYLMRTEGVPASRRIPIFWKPQIDRKAYEAFRKWYERHRPDAVIASNWEVLIWLRHWGVKVPEETAVLLPSTAHPQAVCSGIYEHPERIGRLAVDHLVDMIQRQERGLPDLPQRLLIEGSWIDGETVRPRPRTGTLHDRRWRREQAALLKLPISPLASFERAFPKSLEDWLP